MRSTLKWILTFGIIASPALAYAETITLDVTATIDGEKF